MKLAHHATERALAVALRQSGDRRALFAVAIVSAGFPVLGARIDAALPAHEVLRELEELAGSLDEETVEKPLRIAQIVVATMWARAAVFGATVAEMDAVVDEVVWERAPLPEVPDLKVPPARPIVQTATATVPELSKLLDLRLGPPKPRRKRGPMAETAAPTALVVTPQTEEQAAAARRPEGGAGWTPIAADPVLVEQITRTATLASPHPPPDLRTFFPKSGMGADLWMELWIEVIDAPAPNAEWVRLTLSDLREDGHRFVAVCAVASGGPALGFHSACREPCREGAALVLRGAPFAWLITVPERALLERIAAGERPESRDLTYEERVVLFALCDEGLLTRTATDPRYRLTLDGALVAIDLGGPQPGAQPSRRKKPVRPKRGREGRRT